MVKKETFFGVQFLRFFAALLVVITHATGMVAERILNLGSGQYWVPGLAGVDIFFVISGFVMAVSTQGLLGKADAWKVFLSRRIVRVVPLYWIATSIKIAAVLAFAHYALHARMDIPYLLSSYFFIPALNADGEILPILTVGWTLSFEMFFYLVFTMALGVKVSPLRFVAVVFISLAMIGLFREKDWHPLTVLVSPIILEFLLGMIVAYLYGRFKDVPVWLSATLIISGLILLLYPGVYYPKLRMIFWGVPAFMIVLGFVFAEKWLGARIPKLFTELGDSSYSLYLFHPLVLPIMGVLMLKLGLTHGGLAVVLAILVSLCVGEVMYRLLERPLTNYLNARLKAKLKSGNTQ